MINAFAIYAKDIMVSKVAAENMKNKIEFIDRNTRQRLKSSPKKFDDKQVCGGLIVPKKKTPVFRINLTEVRRRICKDPVDENKLVKKRVKLKKLIYIFVMIYRSEKFQEKYTSKELKHFFESKVKVKQICKKNLCSASSSDDVSNVFFCLNVEHAKLDKPLDTIKSSPYDATFCDNSNFKEIQKKTCEFFLNEQSDLVIRQQRARKAYQRKFAQTFSDVHNALPKRIHGGYSDNKTKKDIQIQQKSKSEPFKRCAYSPNTYIGWIRDNGIFNTSSHYDDRNDMRDDDEIYNHQYTRERYELDPSAQMIDYCFSTNNRFEEVPDYLRISHYNGNLIDNAQFNEKEKNQFNGQKKKQVKHTRAQSDTNRMKSAKNHNRKKNHLQVRNSHAVKSMEDECSKYCKCEKKQPQQSVSKMPSANTMAINVDNNNSAPMSFNLEYDHATKSFVISYKKSPKELINILNETSKDTNITISSFSD